MEFVIYLCPVSAFVPLSCRFRELYIRWHEHQVYDEEILIGQHGLLMTRQLHVIIL